MSDLQTFIQECLPQGWQLKRDQLFDIKIANSNDTWVTQNCEILHNQAKASYTKSGLDLELNLRYDAKRSALCSSIKITNTHADAITLTRVEPLLLEWTNSDYPIYLRRCGGGTNEHNYPPDAFQEKCVRADEDGFMWMENGFDGRSSNFHLPLMTVSNGSSAVTAGLEWSGLWWMLGRGNAKDERAISCHIPINNLKLEPGESLSLPSAHYVFSDGGMAGANNAMRRYIREAIIPQPEQGPLTPQFTYNHWFGIGPNINEDVFKQQADCAKELGIQYVVLDAGWYGGCGEVDFNSGVGNWDSIDTDKFPNGLEPLAQYVKDQGLSFGLWFEVERAHRSSDWVKQHPEWFFDIGQNFLHIDMSNDKAVDACIALVQDAIDRYDCHWLKLDYNIGPKEYWQKADPSGKIQFAYMQGLYRFFDSIRANNPNVILENCASGGRRIDLGTMAHTHVQNLTDQTKSAEICRYTMNGANALLPANICPIGIPFGTDDEKEFSKQQLNSYQLACRFSGLPILYGNIADLSDQDKKLIKSMVDLHQEIADVYQGDYYRLNDQAFNDKSIEAIAHLAPDNSHGLIGIYSSQEKPQPIQINLSALAALSNFKLECDDDWAFSGMRLDEIDNKIEIELKERSYLFIQLTT